jgi:hypothetical protein
MGVVYAGTVAATRSDVPLALVAENAWAVPIGIVVFLALVLGFYAWTRREAGVAGVPGDDAVAPESTYR